MPRFKKYLFLSVVVLFQYCTKPENPAERPVTDIDNNVYETVWIGSQLWMKDNLKVTKLNDGTPIHLGIDSDGWLTTPAYITNGPGGYNYNGYVINTGKICPEGWQVPGPGDFTKELLNYVQEGESLWTSERYGEAGIWYRWFVTARSSSFTRTFMSESSWFYVRCIHESPVTLRARDVSENSAVLTGKLTGPNEGYFEYGETDLYGKKIKVGIDNNSITPHSVTASVTGLDPGKFYHFRITELIEGQTFYGSDKLFFSGKDGIVFNSKLSYGTLKDIDNNVYRTIKIGNQLWMAENLMTARYNDGTAIPFVSGAGEWSQLSSAAYFKNDSTYGALYNWYAIENGRICPEGWHVPSNAEWNVLESYVGSEYITSKDHKLIESGTIHWDPVFDHPDSNETGFTALPSGFRTERGQMIPEGAQWWSSTLPEAPDFQGHYGMSKRLFEFDVEYSLLSSGLSVRCVMD